MKQDVLLEVKHLKQHFRCSQHWTVPAVDGVSFRLKKGEILGLVGESGCGKSTLARTIMGLYQPTAGEVLLKGLSISTPSVARKHRKEIQKSMQIIFQDSAAALNPRMMVQDSIAEPLRACCTLDKLQLHTRIDELLEQVGLDKSFRTKYPCELSGGQQQRVAIARSIAIRPDLIIADEPIASLDVSVQAQILTLFQQLQQEYHFAFLFIAHDLSVVEFLCDTVGVMWQGKLLEYAPAKELFQHPLHDYTKALLSAVPVADPLYERSKQLLEFEPSTVPTSGALQEQCPGHWVYA